MKKCSIVSFTLLALGASHGAEAYPNIAPLYRLKANDSIAANQIDPKILKSIRRDIKKHKKPSFESLLNRWSQTYSTRAVYPLLSLAQVESKLEDHQRYVAIMGAARLGGKKVAPRIAEFVEDQSWMIRAAALRALTALRHAGSIPAIRKLLNDPAMVVRSEAVQSFIQLRPKGIQSELLSVAENPKNYVKGQAQWVVLKAIRGLEIIGAKGVESRLASLLGHRNDRRLLYQTVQTLEKLTGKTRAKGLPLLARAEAWQLALTPAMSDQVRSRLAAPKRSRKK